jgi:hypothetical protein
MKQNDRQDSIGMNRRHFLQLAGGACAGVTLASGLELQAEETIGANSPASTSPNISALEKQFYARSRRHQGECYHPVLNHNTAGSSALLFLRVNGTRESLIYKPAAGAAETVIAKDKYILDPCFAGDRIFWVERDENAWPMKSVRLGALGEVTSPITVTGRPRALVSCASGSRTALAWEERDGKQTKVRLVLIENGEIGHPVDVTDGKHNAYDPACCFDKAGNLFVAYGSFEGQYVIRAQRFSSMGEKAGEPVLLSNNDNFCLFPSLCQSEAGGIWFSYTAYDDMTGASGKEGSGLKNPVMIDEPRYLAQSSFFRKRGRVYAGFLKDGAILIPAAVTGNGGVPPGAVYPSTGAAHSQILENSKGRVYLLFRQHGNQRLLDFAKADAPLNTKKGKKELGEGHHYSGVAISVLGVKGWETPVCLIRNARFDQKFTYSLQSDVLTSAFMEDARATGFLVNGEWYDLQGETALGVLRIGLLSGASPAPIALTPRKNGKMPVNIKNLIVSKQGENGLIYALGQTHAHTEFSVCCREVDRDIHSKYRFFQDVQNLDFAGITDHSYNLWQTEILIGQKVAEYYYFPGKFVGIRAYEYTADPHGHVNPLQFEENQDHAVLEPHQDGFAADYKPLWKVYKGQKVVTPPHHPADKTHTFDWSLYNPDFMVVAEVFQDHRGSGEQPGAPGVTNVQHNNAWILGALMKGDRFGLIASGDHRGLACAGVLTKELTRTALYEALTARRSFGTTGIAMNLLLSCNGQPMGSALNADKGDFRITAETGDGIKEIQVLRDGQLEKTIPVGAKIADASWTSQKQRAGEFWYCRVIMDNGHIAWTSPIWLS